MLEVRATGQYNFIVWIRNGNQVGSSGFPITSDNFAHFAEIYVNDMTTMDDLGRYEVQLPRAQGISPADGVDEIEFTVIAPGKMTIYIIDRHYSLSACMQMVLIQL